MPLAHQVRRNQNVEFLSMTRNFMKHSVLAPIILEAFAVVYLTIQPLPWEVKLFPFAFYLVLSIIFAGKTYTSRSAAQYQFWLGALWSFVSLTLLTMSLLLLSLFLTKDRSWLVALLVGYGGSLFGIWFLCGLVWSQTLPVDQHSGRINVLEGTFCPMIPQAVFQFRNRLVARVVAVIGANGVILAVIGANVGMRMQQGAFTHKELVFNAVAYLLGVLILFAVTSCLYTYRFIRRWERQTGRTMWIKGFEPQVTTAPRR